MEMTQLQHPPMLRGKLLHSRQVIHDHRANSAHGLRRDSRHDLLPASSAFLALQYAMQKGRRRPMRRPPPLSRAHSPGVMALHALAAPLTKPSNRSATTGGFRMFGVHACELPQPPACCPTRKRPSPCQTSTEFLYPSPICDLKASSWFRG